MNDLYPESFCMTAAFFSHTVVFGLTNFEPYVTVFDEGRNRFLPHRAAVNMAATLIHPDLWPAFARSLLDEMDSSNENIQERLFK